MTGDVYMSDETQIKKNMQTVMCYHLPNLDVLIVYLNDFAELSR